VPVSLQAGVFLEKFRWIAETHPQLTLMIDHCGLKVLTKDADALEHLDELLTLARLPNVAIKATAAPAYSSQPYPFRNLHDPLHRIFDAFGPDRFFWGTDLTRMTCSYRQCVTFFTEELPWLKGHDSRRSWVAVSAAGSAGTTNSAPESRARSIGYRTVSYYRYLNRLISTACAGGMFPTWEESPKSLCHRYRRLPRTMGSSGKSSSLARRPQ